MSTAKDAFKVRLENTNYLKEFVVFEAMPDVTETRRANYTQQEPIHGPGGIMVYKNTPSRAFNFSNIRLVSRTSEEATTNMVYLHILKSWLLPQFGNNSAVAISAEAKRRAKEIEDSQKNEGTSVESGEAEDPNNIVQYLINRHPSLGQPPPVLFLSAFTNYVGDSTKPDALKTGAQTNLFRIPVVMTDFTINYGSDSTMIPTLGDNPQPMPTILNLDIQLTETHSPTEYTEKFSLIDYKLGRLEHF